MIAETGYLKIRLRYSHSDICSTLRKILSKRETLLKPLCRALYNSGLLNISLVLDGHIRLVCCRIESRVMWLKLCDSVYLLA